MSILSKLQSLLSAANTATGESDTTITDAMQTLIDGYGQGGTRTPVKLGEYTITEPVRTLQITLTDEMKALDKLYIFTTSPITKDQSDYLYFGFPTQYNGYFTSAISNSLTGMLFNVFSADLGNKHYNAQSFMLFSTVNMLARSAEGSIPAFIRFYTYSGARTLTGGTIEIWG